MKKILTIILIGLSGIIFMADVSGQHDPRKVIEQMQKFSWMVGDWKGEAWYMDRDQTKIHITQKEHISLRLDSTIITMEGTGYEKPVASEETKIVFQAFGILTYDITNSKFVLRAYNDGRFIDSDLISNPDGSFSWRIDVPYGLTRYTLRITADGIWNEKGEFSQDGVSWINDFEMNLTRL